MEFRITQTEYDKIERLARCAISAYSKKDAKPYLTQLEFIANSGGYAGSVRNIISELCMIVYSIIMFTVAIAFIVFAILISKGNTNLINCYHEDRTPDKRMYCKKISHALWIMAVTLIASGVVGLFGETDALAVSAVGILIVGVVCGLCRLFYVQKKYGGGVF